MGRIEKKLYQKDLGKPVKSIKNDKYSKLWKAGTGNIMKDKHFNRLKSTQKSKFCRFG